MYVYVHCTVYIHFLRLRAYYYYWATLHIMHVCMSDAKYPLIHTSRMCIRLCMQGTSMPRKLNAAFIFLHILVQQYILCTMLFMMMFLSNRLPGLRSIDIALICTRSIIIFVVVRRCPSLRFLGMWNYAWTNSWRLYPYVRKASSHHPTAFIAYHKMPSMVEICTHAYETLNMYRTSTQVLLVLQYSRRRWFHAIDAPVCVTVFVADGNGESAVIGSDHLDRLQGRAGDGQLFILTLVRRLVFRSIGAFTWKKKKEIVGITTTITRQRQRIKIYFLTFRVKCEMRDSMDRYFDRHAVSKQLDREEQKYQLNSTVRV